MLDLLFEFPQPPCSRLAGRFSSLPTRLNILFNLYQASPGCSTRLLELGESTLRGRDPALQRRQGTARLSQLLKFCPGGRLRQGEQPHLPPIVVTTLRVNPSEPCDDDPPEHGKRQKNQRDRSAKLS